MQYPEEFMTGIMITSAAFMTVAGIVLAFTSARVYLGKWSTILLLLSLGVGACATASSLAWFDTPLDSKKLVAATSLLIQFIMMFVPLVRLVGLIERIGRPH